MMKTWSILIEFIYDNKYIKSRRGLSEAAFLPLWEHFQFIFIIISAILDQCVGHLAPPSGQSSHVASSSTGSVVTYVHVFQWGPKGSRAMDSRVDAFSSQFEWVTDLVWFVNEWPWLPHTHTHCGLDWSWAEKKCPRTRVDVCQWNELGIHRRQIQFRWGEEDFWGPGKKFVYSACREYISTSANARFCSVHKFIYNTGWPGWQWHGGSARWYSDKVQCRVCFARFLRWKENDDTTTTVLARSERIDRIKVDWTDRGRDDSIGTQTQDGGEKGYSVISIPDGW